MRRFNILAAVAATILVGGIAPAKEKRDQPKEKKICRHEPSSTSRLGTKICRTKKQWEAQRDSGRTEDDGKLLTTGRGN